MFLNNYILLYVHIFYFIIVLLWLKRMNVIFVNIIADFNYFTLINILMFKMINILYLLFKTFLF